MPNSPTSINNKVKYDRWMYVWLILIAIASVLLSGCSITNVQHNKRYSGQITGVIRDVYRNNVGGNTIVIGKYNINVWDEDMRPNYAVDSIATFNVKWLTRPISQ